MHARILWQGSTDGAVLGVSSRIFKLESSDRVSTLVKSSKNFPFFLPFHFPRSSYVVLLFIPLSLLSSFLHLSTTSATKESSIPTPASLAKNAQQDASKIKTASQVLRAKHVQQVTTAPSQVPRRALISVASNHLIARTMNILT